MRNLKQNKAGNTKPALLQYLQEWMEPKRNYNFVLLPTARTRSKTNYIYLVYVYLPDPEVQLFAQLAHVEHHVPLVQRFNDKKGKQQRYEKNFSKC